MVQQEHRKNRYELEEKLHGVEYVVTLKLFLIVNRLIKESTNQNFNHKAHQKDCENGYQTKYFPFGLLVYDLFYVD